MEGLCGEHNTAERTPAASRAPVGAVGAQPVTSSAPLGPPCPACGAAHRVYAGFAVEQKYPLFHCRDGGLGALDIRTAEDDQGFDEYWSDVNQRIYADPAVRAELCAKYEGYFRKVEALVP